MSRWIYKHMASSVRRFRSIESWDRVSGSCLQRSTFNRGGGTRDCVFR